MRVQVQVYSDAAPTTLGRDMEFTAIEVVNTYECGTKCIVEDRGKINVKITGNKFDITKNRYSNQYNVLDSVYLVLSVDSGVSQ